MAFHIAAESPTISVTPGAATAIGRGTVVLVAGTATVDFPQLFLTSWAVASQTSNAARVSATTATSITITGTSTDTVNYTVFGNIKF